MQSTAKVADKTDRQLAMAQNFQRKARFYLAFVETENSTAFPTPQEAARILGESVDFCATARESCELERLNHDRF